MKTAIVNNVIAAIQAGDCDGYLDRFENVVRARRHSIARAARVPVAPPAGETPLENLRRNAEQLPRRPFAARRTANRVARQTLRQQFPVGSTVEFNSGRPRYLIGARAEVVGYGRSKIKVRMISTRRRFVAGQIVHAPASCLRLVEAEAPAN